MLAFIIALVISMVDRRRDNYRVLLKWLIVLVRYYLAALMINYGLSKLFYLQFTFLSEVALTRDLGEFSPMGLLWNFMGYSKGYTMFAGALEFIAGLLLLNRRTHILGTLMTFGVMLNVMMLNYCYDVPVKLSSTHMVLMSLFLISLRAERLYAFFISNRKIEPYSYPELIPAKYYKLKTILKWLMIMAYLSLYISSMWGHSQNNKSNDVTLISGKYKVESFERKRPASDDSETSNYDDWKEFYQVRKGYALVKTKDDYKLNYRVWADTIKNLIHIKLRNESDFQKLQYEFIEPELIRLSGVYKFDTLDILMRKDEIPLLDRGFHWVTEYPYNY